MTKTCIDIEDLDEVKIACIRLKMNMKDLVNAAVREYLKKKGYEIKKRRSGWP